MTPRRPATAGRRAIGVAWLVLGALATSSACAGDGRPGGSPASEAQAPERSIAPLPTPGVPTTAPPTTASPVSPTTAAPPRSEGGPEAPSDARGPYPVVEVVDGDTARVSIDGRPTTIRLIGIDTPETRDPRRPVECFGREASARAKELLGGQLVTLTGDPTQDRIDRHGRTLAYVWLPDGRSFQWRMLHDGFANEYTYDLPYRYQPEFRAAQVEARTAGRGLWAEGTCDGDVDRPAPPVEPATTTVTIARQPALSSSPGAGCEADSGWCVPEAGGDIDCSTVDGPIAVGPADPNGLDGDGDGIGCEG